MATTNLIDSKYLYLPSQFHAKHDVCWELVKELEEFITDEKFFELTAQAIKIDEETLASLKSYKGGDLFDFLLSVGRKEEHDYIAKHQLIRGLISDSCYFLQEALSCSLKNRHVVALSLFRRPLVYNMVILIKLKAEEGFLEKFIQGKVNNGKKETVFDPAKIDSAELKRILSEDDFFSIFFGNELFEFVFDKSNPDSLINMSNRALHPVTTSNENIMTGAMNLNFAFSSEQDTLAQWDYIYRKILFIIFFYVTLVDVIVFSNLRISEETHKLYESRLEDRQKLMSSVFGEK